MMKSWLLTTTALAVLATALGGYVRHSFVISTLNSCDGFSAVTFVADPANRRGLASCCMKCLKKQLQQQQQPCVNNGSNCGCSAVQFNPSATTNNHCVLLSGAPLNDSCGVIAVGSASTVATLYGDQAYSTDNNFLQTTELPNGFAKTDGHATATVQQYATDFGATFIEQHATYSTSAWSTAGGDMSSSRSSEQLTDNNVATKFSYPLVTQVSTRDAQTQGNEASTTAPSVASDSIWQSSWPALKLTKSLIVSNTAEAATSQPDSVTSSGSSNSGSSGSSNSGSSSDDNANSNSSSSSSSSSGSPHLNLSSALAFPDWQATSAEPIIGNSSFKPTGVGEAGPATTLPDTSKASWTSSPPVPPPVVAVQPAAVANSTIATPTSGAGAVSETYHSFTTITWTHSAAVSTAVANQLDTSLPPPPAIHTEVSPRPPCTAPPNGDMSVCASAAPIAVSETSTKIESPPLTGGTSGQPLNSDQSLPPPPPSSSLQPPSVT